MKKIELGQAVAILANIGVIAGIVFLAFELQQNREMIRAQTRNELSQTIVDLMVSVADNDELANLRRRADSSEELTDDEAYRYSYFSRALFRHWENVHYQYRLGFYDEPEFQPQKDSWARYIKSSTAALDWWCQFRYEFSPDFIAEMNGVLDAYACPQ